MRFATGQHGGVIGGAIGKYVSDQIGVAQGFGLGAARAATGTASLAVSVFDVTNPVSWVLDTERNIDHVMSTYRTLDTIDSVTSLGRWAADPQQSLHNATALWDGVTAEYRKDLAAGDASKAVGRLGLEVVSAGAPLLAAKVGKAGTIARAADEAAAAAAARGGDVSAVGVGRGSDPIDALRGPVAFRAPPGATPEEIAQLQAYVKGSNEALQAGALSPTGRVTTKGSLRIDASAAAGEKRARALANGRPYQGDAGHVPDTTWTGNAQPHSWLDLSPRVSSSLGGQATRYPVGYRSTLFIFEGPE
ncbi:hypothetical protein [Luteibacter sp. 3190]|uniref:hypothetical protein n=1 Tax=Luteibacter sp. 3190 TaxID=2817736 RepID=UPI002857F632|nr:hypothetical protein [Luteibacter sp. 3190]MDR6937891.1 hypothetical protein [Luteibacter sp. 3190]